MPPSKTFLITGVSSGLGRAFAAGALAAGRRVIGTVRRPEDARTFGTSKGAFPLLLDVTNYSAVRKPCRRSRLFLGEDALGLVAQKLEQMKREIAAWDDLSRSTNFAP